jgi:predicted homoserine dehydrogenase-like protein
MELVSKLKKRSSEGNPIRIGIVGCGQMGSGLAHTINNIEGMCVTAIADIAVERGIQTYTEMGHSADEIVVTENIGKAQDAIKAGKVVVTPDAFQMPVLESLEALVEVTGVPDNGARVA